MLSGVIPKKHGHQPLITREFSIGVTGEYSSGTDTRRKRGSARRAPWRAYGPGKAQDHSNPQINAIKMLIWRGIDRVTG